MNSWLSSWLPGLPSLNFTLPASLQGKFISFILKKTLGHFLKPGQLDIHQIDSQIGSGFVQISELELDNETINALLSDLPIALHDGYISSVKARVPWPNPLTSTLGFSLESLHLTFHLRPSPASVRPKDANLADSVLSVAESFIQDELTPKEARMWDSIYVEATHPTQSDEGVNVPGGLDLDPFLSNPEDVIPSSETDPSGVSIFATLIERLLARFEFDAVNTKITIVHPGNMSITALIPEIRYRTEIVDENPSGTASGQRRFVNITGITLTTRNLRAPLSKSFSGPSPSDIDLLGSPSSSDSELDEDTQLAMSQSIADLPPRLIESTNSLGSSMYQSAISTSPMFSAADSRSDRSSSKTPSPRLKKTQSLHGGYVDSSSGDNCVREEVNRDHEILSFGSTPLVLELANRPGETPAPQGTSDWFHFSITSGVIALALSAWHVRAMLELSDVVSQHSISPAPPKPSTSKASEAPPIGIDFTLSLQIRGVVLLLLLPSLSGESDTGTVLSEYYKRPLVPPVLPSGYFRLFIDGISGSAAPQITSNLSRTRKENSGKSLGKPIPTSLFINDVSIFSVYDNFMTSPTAAFPLCASPVLLTDRDLSSQYSSRHLHPGKYDFCPPLPTFDVVDWTDEKYHSYGMKLSSWRTKTKRGQDKGKESGSGAPLSKPLSAVHASAAISVVMTKAVNARSQDSSRNEVEISVIPLQLLLDLGKALMFEKTMAFLNEALDTLPRRGTEREAMDPDIDSCSDIEDLETPPASPRARSARQKEKDRRRLEVAREGLGLDFDYSDKLPTRAPPRKLKTQHVKSSTKISAKCEMIRLQMRCPPPPGRSPRSGALVLDFRSIKFSTAPWPLKTVARFAEDDSLHTAEAPSAHQNFVFGTEIRRIVVACSPARGHTATAIFSSGPIDTGASDDLSFGSNPSVTSPLQPRLSVTTLGGITNGSPVITAISVELPSVHVDISKVILDSLQYWVDDVSQLAERTFGRADGHDGEYNGDDEDLIGSRFFAKSRSSSALATSAETTRYEIVVKVAISDACIRAMVPSPTNETVCPFILSAADVDVLLEMKPEGKDETVITLGMMDLALRRIPATHSIETLLSLTTPRSLSSAPISMVKLRFTSIVVPGTTAKESKVKMTLWGFTYTLFPNISWLQDLAAFSKSPPGTFESVIPTERTSVQLKIHDGSIRAFAPQHPGAIVLHVGDLEFSTVIVGNSPESSFRLSVPALAFLAIDDISNSGIEKEKVDSNQGLNFWKNNGFALLAEVADLSMCFKQMTGKSPNSTDVRIDGISLRLHLCADSLAAVTAFFSDFGSIFANPEIKPVEAPSRHPAVVAQTQPMSSAGLMDSVDDLAFRRLPEIGPAPDMINDDLPTNMDYLDESFGAAAGLRELDDDDLDEFDANEVLAGAPVDVAPDGTGIISTVGGETIKMLKPEGIQVVDNYFDTLPPDVGTGNDEIGETTLRLRANDGNITLLLYDGYDWLKTRKIIENEVKEMRRRLTKIRQLVATGQVPDSSGEETSALLFNSVYIGLDRDVDGMDAGAILAAIDEELKDDFETATQSSWQSLQSPGHGKARSESARVHGKRLTRSKGSSIEFCLTGLKAEVDNYPPNEPLVSRTLVTVRDLEILDHIKTSTWKKFLTELRSDSRGNIRETDSNMVRVELRSVHPVPGHPSQEARLRAKILPLRLYVDQDAVDFLKKFFGFKDPDAAPPDSSGEEIYFQLAEVFPVDLKLDYKPRRVDYKALREGRTIELMNFFHFDGAEMTLRHITLAGITGWPRLFDLLNDLWTPDVKATQLVEVISGVAPIRSVVNVGSGVADLVLLPIAQYKKDGRIVRGLQKGTTAFVRSTATEAIKLGARLATGTQVILEQAEGVLGGQFQNPVTAETVHGLFGDDFMQGSDEEEDAVDISKYAQQPGDLTEGIQSAYKSLRKNLNSAAQTILAVPMEVYERSENEGPVRAVIRAVPIAVLKPMIGASEAVSKTLLGLHNTLDPNSRHDNEAKYKRRQPGYE